MLKSLFKYSLVIKDLSNLTAKEKTQLLRIYAGKDAEKILTPEQLQKAKDIINGSR